MPALIVCKHMRLLQQCFMGEELKIDEAAEKT